MKIEIVDSEHIRIKDGLGNLFDVYTLKEGGGIQIISTAAKGLEIENRLPCSIIVREK